MGAKPDDQLDAKRQVEAEAEIANKLLTASDDDRRAMYAPAYDSIFQMHLERNPDVLEFGATSALLPLLDRLTRRGDRVLEIGCGAGLLSIGLAERGRVVTGGEVSDVILTQARGRDHDQAVTWQLLDGIKLPFEDSSFDFCFSVEVLEHLHESDTRDHLREVRRVLRPGGRYWIETPSAYDHKPHGAADRFGVEDVHPDGDVHLKEWTYGEIIPALSIAGFKHVRVPFRDQRGRLQRYFWLPLLPVSVYPTAERHPRLKRVLDARRVSVVAVNEVAVPFANPFAKPS